MSNVIIEGPDATGKSTLARFLSNRLSMPIQESEGAPKSYEELSDRITRYSTIDNTIFVRHPLISNPIYDTLRLLDGKNAVGTPKISLYKNNPIFISCAPTSSILPAVHTPNANDTEEHLNQVQKFYLHLCQMYKRWADYNAHLHYTIGNNMGLIAHTVDRLRFDPVADLEQFHTHFDIAYYGKPRFLPEELFDFRYKFLDEELTEYYDAHMETPPENPHPVTVNLAGQLDSLVDLVYVALGNSYLQGFNFREAWRRVHAANMTKIRANSASDSMRKSMYDVVKPKGFVPPSHTDLVEDHAHAHGTDTVDEKVSIGS